MLSCLAASLLAVPSTGIVAVDGIAVGIVEEGRWRSMDSTMSDSWPKKTISDDTVSRISSQGGTVLGRAWQTRPSQTNIEWGSEDGSPGDRGWVLRGPGHDVMSIVWFGPAASAPSGAQVASSSAAAVRTAAAWLAKNGRKNAKPVVTSVVTADIDGNGSRDTLIFASSRKDDQMYERFNVGLTGKVVKDYSVVLFQSGGGAATALYYSAAKNRDAHDFHWTFGGLWELDGKPGPELIIRGSAYESFWATVANVSQGKVRELATAGDGS